MIRRPRRSTLFPYTPLSLYRPGYGASVTSATPSWNGAAAPPTTGAAPTPSAVSPWPSAASVTPPRSEEQTSELQSRQYLVCRLLLAKKKLDSITTHSPHSDD